MGMGIGIFCERCGEQISYGETPFLTKEHGDKHNICGKCLKEKKQNEFDKENKDWWL